MINKLLLLQKLLSNEGETTVYYRAEDSGANVGIEQSVTVRIDTTPPSAECTASGSQQNGWYTSNVVINCSDSDSLSGRNSLVFNLNGTGNLGYFTGLTIYAENNHTLTYFAKDIASNVSTTRSLSLPIDKTAPTLSSFTMNNGAALSYLSTVQLSQTAQDNASGVQEVCLSFDQSSWECRPFTPEMSIGLPAVQKSTPTVYLRVKDRAGHTSTILSDSISLDFYPARPRSANYRLCSSVFPSVAGIGQSSSYRLVSTGGQSADGVSSSSNYRLSSGFLARYDRCQAIVAPTGVKMEPVETQENRPILLWIVVLLGGTLLLTAALFAKQRRNSH